ncbi:amidohydrolase [Sneathiella litorea]|uniref:Amidohydrolase family protein n=1 Tax=Sneathiella litorea TaxID=2606216 RepID=A0A6L8WAN6_9PROT|nr:amidohydrolase [Sneathiella litorea]MZR31510.1 amidohydrolase family protein [Sneathiella litorea]
MSNNNVEMTADLVIVGGKIATLDPNDRIVSAIAVKDGRITKVGSDVDVRDCCGPDTQVIEANGRLVTPGLIDGHAHMDREGLKELLPSLSGCRSIDDILQKIEALVQDTAPGEWVVTMPIGEPPFYEGVPEILKENKFPSRRDLDRVSPNNPVYIRPIWGHWRNTLPLVSVANTRALEAAGITAQTMPPAPSIVIDKESGSGEPSGIFYEYTYKPLVEKTLMSVIPAFTLEDRIAGLRRSMEVYNSTGTTSVFEGHGVAGEVLAAYQTVYEQGPLPVRSSLMFSPAWPNANDSDVKDLLVDWGRWLSGRGLGDENLRVAGIYTESDYSEENRLRATCGPYTGWAGFNFDSALPEDIMVEMMTEAAKAGIRVGSFSPNLLDLYERVNKRAPIVDQRWIIEHIGIYDRDEIKRISDLGLVLQSYTNKYIWQDGEQLRADLGEEGASRVVPMRDLLDAGVHVSLATDNVPPTMLAPIWHVVSRMTEGGTTPLGEDQKISRLEALACASREGAWLSFEEDFKGTLEVGKAADMVIFEEDLLTIDEDDLPHQTASMTIVNGDVVYSK